MMDFDLKPKDLAMIADLEMETQFRTLRGFIRGALVMAEHGTDHTLDEDECEALRSITYGAIDALASIHTEWKKGFKKPHPLAQ